MIKDLLDILIIAETKLGDAFPKGQFLIEGFKQSYRLDVTANSGGLLVYLKEGIISKELNKENISKEIQRFVSVFTGENSAQCHEGRANYNRIEAIKQTTFFVVTQSFTLSSDLQVIKRNSSYPHRAKYQKTKMVVTANLQATKPEGQITA